MNAVATHNARPHSTDSSEIAKMVLIGVMTLVLMTLTILGSSPSRADNSVGTNDTSDLRMSDQAIPFAR